MQLTGSWGQILWDLQWCLSIFLESLSRSFWYLPLRPLRIQSRHCSLVRQLTEKDMRTKWLLHYVVFIIFFIVFFLLLQCFQFIYICRHNQQFSGNSKVTGLALFRVIKAEKYYTKKIPVSLLYGWGEVWFVRCLSEGQKGKLRKGL